MQKISLFSQIYFNFDILTLPVFLYTFQCKHGFTKFPVCLPNNEVRSSLNCPLYLFLLKNIHKPLGIVYKYFVNQLNIVDIWTLICINIELYVYQSAIQFQGSKGQFELWKFSWEHFYPRYTHMFRGKTRCPGKVNIYCLQAMPVKIEQFKEVK